jgi:hypothetical protein
MIIPFMVAQSTNNLETLLISSLASANSMFLSIPECVSTLALEQESGLKYKYKTKLL